MNSADWEKLRKNWNHILDIQAHHVCANLFQNEVITERDKEAVGACKTNTRQMEKLLSLLKSKPTETQAFSKFLDAIKEDYDWLVDQIEGTPTHSDERVKEPGDPHQLDDSVRTTLRKYFANKEGVSTPLSEIRDVLNKERIFTGANEWNNPVLQDFIRHEFVGVKSELKKKREGKSARRVFYITNLGKINPAQNKDQRQSLAEKDKSSGSLQVQEKVSELNPPELKKYLKPQFEASGLPTEILDEMEKEMISGKVFLTLKEEDLKELFPSSTFGQRRSLSMLIQENQPVTEAPSNLEYPRPFDSEVSHIHKYYKGRCMDAGVNVRGKRTERVKNFRLCSNADKDSTLQFISSELIPFVSACLNDRRDGTIYFGISPADGDEYKAGDVVGLNLSQEEVSAEINESLKLSYLDEQSNIIQATVRDAKFIPVISPGSSADSQLWVIEVDVKPSDSILREDKVRTNLKNLPLHAKKSKSKEWAIFTFSDEGKPKVVDSGELDKYERNQPRIIKQRQVEEEEVRKGRESTPNLRDKLLNLLTGGKETLEDTIYPFILTSPIDSHMDMEYLSNNVTFIKSLEAEVVFDFDPKGSSNGIYKNMDTEQNEVMRVLTTDNFDKNTYKNKEGYEEFVAGLKSENSAPWVFCNGYDEMTIERMNPTRWNRHRRQAFENSLRFFKDNFDMDRIIVIICLFSKDYETMVEACDVVLKVLPDNWMLLAESSEIAKLWQDQVVLRHIVEKEDLKDSCVIGMPWAQVNETIQLAVRTDEIYGCSVPSSTGAMVEINEKKIKDWSDIDILHSADFPDWEDNDRKRKQAEEQFYRGEKASWLNFWYHDQVLKREIHGKLIGMVRNALRGEKKEEEDRINCVTILHQPGAGGTTSAKHVLWELRREYRCCVVQTITDQTCDQLDEFRRYKDTTPRPLLILIDNEDEDKYLQLTGHLEEKARKQARCTESSMDIYFTIIHCTRRAELPRQIRKDNQIPLYQELKKPELDWFRQKNEHLESRFKKDQKSNVNPKFLISFNILRENFNENYVSNVVKEFSNTVEKSNEVTLLKVVSFLNTYDPEFKSVPVSCLDNFLKYSDYPSSRRQPRSSARNQKWEATLSDGVKVLLNLSSDRSQPGRPRRSVRVFNKIIAQEILRRMKERTDEKESEIMTQLMESGVFENEQKDMKELRRLVSNIMKKREYEENGTQRKKFSRFVLYVQKNEGDEVAVNLLKRLFDLSGDPFAAQLVARFYIELKNWDYADKYAVRAINLYPTNSFLWDTRGQVFKNQLFEKISSTDAERTSLEQIRELIQLTESCIDVFRKEQQVSEQETTTLGDNNFAGYFGELRAILLLLDALSKCPVFPKDSGMLHRYLVDKHFYPRDTGFLNEDEHKFLKELEFSSREVMRRLDEEYLQIKNHSSMAENWTVASDYTRDTLLELKVNLDRFFGDVSEKSLVDLTPSDRCMYNRRKAFHLGANTLRNLLSLRDNSQDDKLLQIYSLLIGNVSSPEHCSFDDLRSILDTVTVLFIDHKSPPQLRYEVVLNWCRQLYQMNSRMARPSKASHIYLEPFLYFVLYNFPTQERLQHSICLVHDLRLAIDSWNKNFERKYPDCHHERARKKEKTIFFLGNGQPLKDIVHENSLDILGFYTLNEKWQAPGVRKHLRLLTGVLCSSGDKINYQITTGEGNKFNLQILTSHRVTKKDMWQKQVYFYLGFSFSGLRAFGMSLEELGKLSPTKRILRQTFFPTTGWRQQRPSLLDELIREKNELELKFKGTQTRGRDRQLEERYYRVCQNLGNLLGESYLPRPT